MILILGGSGYVGQAFQRNFVKHGVTFKSLSRRDADFGDIDKLVNLLRESKPTFVVNAAGYTGKPNVDACEEHKHECLLGNAVLPGIIRQACEKMKIPWGHVSSGCIYLGRRADGNGFTEEDSPNFSFRSGPCSFYSGTKALGEEILAGANKCYVWRLRIPFDHRDGPRNYITRILQYERLLDVENSISHLDDFVRACWRCWSKEVPFGCYNVTNSGAVTTREVTERIRKHFALRRRFRFFDDEVQFMKLAAKTPRSSCVLSTAKLKRVGITMPDVQDALDRALTHWRPSVPSPTTLRARQWDGSTKSSKQS